MYIIIEKHGGAENAVIVTNENGENMVFNTMEEAEEEAKDCLSPIIIEI